MSDFLVFGSGLALWLYALQQRSLPWLASLTAMKGVASAGWLVTALTVSTTHLMYAFIWYNPKKFTSICARPPLRLLGDHPVDIFHHLVIFLKALQQLAAATLFAGGSMTTLVSMIAATSATEWGVMMVLMAVGQLLNAAIYKAIGKDGVYFGFKLGRHVPWSTAFPFNAGFRHPQYVGATLSQLAVLLPLATPAGIEAGLAPLAAFWIVAYAATSYMEASGDNDGS
uniref:phosphatidyl-N-methylethanolamine N-methyltransferase n=1 Tax=Haptolina brevifila TaxID=156173 RepID=A0A7S2J3R7_9EUKA